MPAASRVNGSTFRTNWALVRYAFGVWELWPCGLILLPGSLKEMVEPIHSLWMASLRLLDTCVVLRAISEARRFISYGYC